MPTMSIKTNGRFERILKEVCWFLGDGQARWDQKLYFQRFSIFWYRVIAKWYRVISIQTNFSRRISWEWFWIFVSDGSSREATSNKNKFWPYLAWSSPRIPMNSYELACLLAQGSEVELLYSIQSGQLSARPYP